MFGASLASRPVPDLDAATKAECEDPGVSGQLVADLANTRLALADCRRRHLRTVAAYEGIQRLSGAQ